VGADCALTNLLQGQEGSTVAMAMQTATTRAQMRLAPAGVPAQRGTTPQGTTPLLKPLGASARAIANLKQSAPKLQAQLFSAASNQLNAAAPGFVRPDCPPDSADELARRMPAVRPDASDKIEYSRDGGSVGDIKPSFRSALEQASWMTATEQAGRADSRRSGKFGLGFLGL